MIQNSLDRLLDGIGQALVTSIAPAVDDPYVRAQAVAAAEILANLSSRVTWDPGYLAGPVHDADGAPLDVSAGALEALAGARLEALGETAARAWRPDATDAERQAARVAVDGELEAELTRLRRAPRPTTANPTEEPHDAPTPDGA